MKNRPVASVQNGTTDSNCPESRDRRVGRTRAALHHAALGLAREKPYVSVAVSEILRRANVGRSTFYMHFRDKEEVLESGMWEALAAINRAARSGVGRGDPILSFSLPLFELIDQHRRAAGPPMSHAARNAMHTHLQEALTRLLEDTLETSWRRTTSVPMDLVAQHIASTFALVLTWWVEKAPLLTPADVDARFRSLAAPVLASLSLDRR